MAFCNIAAGSSLWFSFLFTRRCISLVRRDLGRPRSLPVLGLALTPGGTAAGRQVGSPMGLRLLPSRTLSQAPTPRSGRASALRGRAGGADEAVSLPAASERLPSAFPGVRFRRLPSSHPALAAAASALGQQLLPCTAQGQPATQRRQEGVLRIACCQRCALLTRVFFKFFYLFLKYVT